MTMPKQITRTVYEYHELSDKAKERARDWLREACAGDSSFAEPVTDQFHEALKALGFDPYVRDGSYIDPRDPRAVRSTVEWSGFGSQGSGAAFSGTWRASDFAPGKLLADRPAIWEREGKTETCASNAELHRIAGVLRECKKAGLRYAAIRASNRGFFMSVDSTEVEDDGGNYADAPDDLAEKFIEAARDLARQFYRDLEAEYEYQNSDEQIADSIVANGYTFDVNGRREG